MRNFMFLNCTCVGGKGEGEEMGRAARDGERKVEDFEMDCRS
jgi:hypothetical protein